jgi:predicted nucleotidyltransferase
MRGDIEETLLLLSRAGVRFIVVGGVAVVLHGFLRLTADLDLVLDLDEENVLRAMNALESAGFVPRAPVKLSDFATAEVRRRWIDEKNLQVFSLWSSDRPGFEVDLFVEEPFDFNEAWSSAEAIVVQGAEVRIVSIDHLIAMKRTAGRPHDLEDIAALETLRRQGETR